MGHDIGHTPFGHIGERTLNYIMTGCDDIKKINANMEDKYKGFKHNLQGLRVVMELEKQNICSLKQSHNECNGFDKMFSFRMVLY